MSNTKFMDKLLDGAGVEWKALGHICKIETGKLNANAAIEDGEFMFFTTAKETSRINKYRWDTEALLIAGNANVGEVKHYIGKFEAYQRTYVLTNFFKNMNVRFLFFVLGNNFKKYLEEKTNTAVMTYIVLPTLENFLVPIPCPENPKKSLEIQSEIVRILDAFTAIITELTTEFTLRKQQYNYYRNQLLNFKEGEMERKTLGEVFDIFIGGDAPKHALSESKTEEFNIPVLSNGIGKSSLYGWTDKAKIEKPSLTISARGTIGWTSFRDKPFFPIVRLLVLTPKIELNLKYAYYFMKTIENSYKVPEAGIPQLTKPMVKDIQIPIPYPNDPKKSLAEQARIVAILDKFDTLTNSITEGIPREIELRQKQYAYYRNLLLSFPKPEENSVLNA